MFLIDCAFYITIALISHRALCYSFSVTIPHERSIGAQLQKYGTAPPLLDYAALLEPHSSHLSSGFLHLFCTLFASENERLLMFWRSKLLFSRYYDLCWSSSFLRKKTEAAIQSLRIVSSCMIGFGASITIL